MESVSSFKMNTVTESYWLIYAAATVSVIFSHWVNLKLALWFHALVIVTIMGNPRGIFARNHPKSAQIHQHAVKRYPNSWTLMESVQWLMQSIHGLALYTVLNPTKAAGGVWWIWYTWLHTLFTGLYCGVLNPTKAAGGVWWIWYTWLHALFTGLGVLIHCGVLNPTKAAAGGVWWIWYTWLHTLFTGLYCGVLNPTKAAGGVWWIWYTCSIHWAILWSTESNKSSRWSLMDLVHMATCSIHWDILWSTEYNKSSRWSLMDLVHMCSIRWAIL